MHLAFVLLFALCLAKQTTSTAFADEDNLILPNRVGANVELVLHSDVDARVASDLIQVFVGKPEVCCRGRSPMAGTYLSDGQAVLFDPVFDFVKDQSYTVLTHGINSAGERVPRLAEFTIPLDTKLTNPEVVAIYPSGDEIPENTLRFYIHFSTPMTPHKSAEFIHLVDADNQRDPAAFMTFKQELWNADRTRLTLLLDPGRIKRGVARNLTLGPALLEGRRHSIVIEKGWPSANGEKAAPRFEQPFTVSRAVRTLPDTKLWQYSRPVTTTHDPLVIRFDRPFDLHSVQSAIAVLDENGERIAGIVTIEDHQKTWRFQPEDRWTTTSVRLLVDARLEDVAGNNFRDLLDHEVDSGLNAVDQHEVTLELQPSPG